MRPPPVNPTGVITERLRGIVDRVTFHNADNGWSVLRVSPFDTPHQQETVIVHQTKVFAGATMEFFGEYCDALKEGEVDKVSATFGCPTIVID